MRYGGISSWPPVWTQTSRSGTKTVRGEVGVLRYIHYINGGSTKCFLVIEHENQDFVGTLLIDHAGFCAQLARLLQLHVGRPIAEIGNIDLSSTL